VGQPASLRYKFITFLLVLLILVALTRNFWLTAIGQALIFDEGPAKAQIAVVLAGDPWGQRLIKGAELVREGYVPQVLVSGPPGLYEANEADAAIQFAVRKGYPAGIFVPLHHDASSTQAESIVVLDWLKQHNIQSFLLVTSDFHTARAHRIFLAEEKQRGGGPSMRVVAAGDHYFKATAWWQSREARKTVFFEWTKTVATVFGL